MKKLIYCLVVATFSISLVAPLSVAQEKTKAQREKDVLIANIVALRNKETRVTVLQQLLNDEMNGLRRMQAVFCDQYKLDLNKFRAGQYVYDEEKGKFVEKKAEPEIAPEIAPPEKAK
jgi:hypothetical protein